MCRTPVCLSPPPPLLPSSPFSTPFSVFFRPCLPPSKPPLPPFVAFLRFMDSSCVHGSPVHECVYHKAGIVERPNDTHRYVSSSFSSSSSSFFPSPFSIFLEDASDSTRYARRISIYEGWSGLLVFLFDERLTNGACLRSV